MRCWVTVVRVAGLETPPAQTVGRALLPGAVGAALHGGDWQLWVEETQQAGPGEGVGGQRPPAQWTRALRGQGHREGLL